ncbi:uncharacterized protein LOC125074017 isoform X2 [Vanessa atalanta]|nr:uncharacterized protein LOC125074017 isoform X2 [Vanessa atalanta]XP_047541142.1 uncharacterized protein LOC125074017 isoform X2 [Vanessa atalanta]XP_047541143.1 uncharacterized protein LOC125074017 isoform X2 [Vanessa atalanta]XP_047541144.1 uncharacterized protein LOC125074017 isoform X2 [Vanessa atalanta]
MKIITSITVLSLLGVVFGAPISIDKDDEKILITKSMFPKEFIKYKAEHEIVNLLVPTNSLNLNADGSSESSSEETEREVFVFFVEADINSNGDRVDQGLYVLKEGKATKLLDHGRDAAASYDDSKLVFFGAKDGIYVYNKENNSADKYGTVDDSIIGIAKEKTGDVIYILTENHELFKVSNGGTTKEKLDDVVNAKQIVLDSSNNIYFYSDDKQAYVRTSDGIKKIEGLPENPSSVTLIKPPFILENGVPVIVDNVVYIIYANGKSQQHTFEFKSDAKPSAFAPEATLLQYYAYDKNIYEYKIISITMGSMLEELKSYLKKSLDYIQSLSMKNRNNQ